MTPNQWPLVFLLAVGIAAVVIVFTAFYFGRSGVDFGENITVSENGNITTRGKIIALNVTENNDSVVQQNFQQITTLGGDVTTIQNQINVIETDISAITLKNEDNTSQINSLNLDITPLQEKTQFIENVGGVTTISSDLNVVGNIQVTGSTSSSGSVVNVYDGYISITQNDQNVPALSVTQSSASTGPVMIVTEGTNTIFEIGQNTDVYTSGSVTASGFSTSTGTRSVTFSVEGESGDTSTIGDLTVGGSISSDTLSVSGDITANNFYNTNTGDQNTFTTIGGVSATSTDSSVNFIGGTGVDILTNGKNITFEFDNVVLQPLVDKTQYLSATGGITTVDSLLRVNGNLSANNLQNFNTGDQNLFAAVGSVTADSLTTTLEFVEGNGIEITTDNTSKTLSIGFDTTLLDNISNATENITSVTEGTETTFSGTISASNLQGSNTGDQLLFSSIGGVPATSTTSTLTLTGGTGVDVVTSSNDITFTFNDSVLTPLNDKTQYLSTTPGKTTIDASVSDIGYNVTASNISGNNSGDQNNFASIAGVVATTPSTTLNIVAGDSLTLTSNNVGKSINLSLSSATETTINELDTKTQFLSSNSTNSTFSSDLIVEGDVQVTGSTSSSGSSVNLYDGYIQVNQNNGSAPALEIEQTGTGLGPIMNVKDADNNTVFSISQNAEIETSGGIDMKGDFTLGPNSEMTITSSTGNLTTTGTVTASNLSGSNTGDQLLFTTIGGVEATSTTSSLNITGGTGVTITNPTLDTVQLNFDNSVLASLDNKTQFISVTGGKTEIDSELDATGYEVTATNLTGSNSGDQDLFSTIGGVTANSKTTSLNLSGSGITITPNNSTKTLNFAFNQSELATLNDKTQNMSSTGTTTNFVGVVTASGDVNSSNVQGYNGGDQLLFSTIGGVTATSTTTALNLTGNGITITPDNAAKTITFSFNDGELTSLNDKTQNMSSTGTTTNFDGAVTATGEVRGSNVQNTNTGDQLLFTTIGGVTATSTTSSLNITGGSGVTITNPTSDTVQLNFDNSVLDSLNSKTQFISVTGGKTEIDSELDATGYEVTATNLTGSNSGDQNLFSTIGGVTVSSKTTSLAMTGNGITITPDNTAKSLTFAFNDGELTALNDKTQNMSSAGTTTNFDGVVTASGEVRGSNVQNTNTGDQDLFSSISVGSETLVSNSTSTTVNLVGGSGVSITTDNTSKDVTFSFNGVVLDDLLQKTQNLSYNPTDNKTTVDGILQVNQSVSANNLTGTNTGDQFLFSSIGGVAANSTTSSLNIVGGTGVDVTTSSNNVTFAFNDSVLTPLNDKTQYLSTNAGKTTITGDLTVPNPGTITASNLNGSNTGDQNAFTSIGGVSASSTTSSVGFVNGGNIIITNDQSAKTVTFAFDSANALSVLNGKTQILSSTSTKATIGGGLTVTGNIEADNLTGSNTGDQNIFSSVGGVTPSSTSSTLSFLPSTGVIITPDDVGKTITFGFDSNVLTPLNDKTQNLSATANDSTFANDLKVEGNLQVMGSTTTTLSDVNIYNGYVAISQNPADVNTPALEITQVGATTGEVVKVNDGDSNTIFSINQNADVTTDGTTTVKGDLTVGDPQNPVFAVTASTGDVASAGSITATGSATTPLINVNSGTFIGDGADSTVNTNLTVGNTVQVNNFTLNTDAMVVSGISGNATFKGRVTADSYEGITASALPNGIPATNIGGGEVTNAVFNYLDEVTSNIQDQIDSIGGRITAVQDKSVDISYTPTTTTVANTLAVTGNETVNSLSVTGTISGASFTGITASALPNGIPATNIGGGGVTNAVFNYLDGVGSNIQNQLTSGVNSVNTLDGKTSLLSTSSNTSTITGNLTATGTFTADSYSGITAANLPNGIPATKIGGGEVTNAVFNYLDEVTSNIQDQINTASTRITALQDKTTKVSYTTETLIDGPLTVNGGVTANSYSGITAANLPNGIPATKIGGGEVTNDVFNYLDEVTSNIQDQINTVTGRITALQGKTVDITYTPTTTTVANTLAVTGNETVNSLSVTGTITGASFTGIQAGNIPSGIDATKISTGVVTNQMFGYLSDVTSQINPQFATINTNILALNTKTTGLGYTPDTTSVSIPLSVTGGLSTTSTGSFTTVSATNIGTIAALTIPTTDKVLYVSNLTGNDSNTGYTQYNAKKTIAATITAATSGTQIVILPGAYNEAITFTKNNLTLTGMNYESGGLISIPNTVSVGNFSNTVRIQGVTITTLNHTGSGGIIVNNCRIGDFTSSGSGAVEITDSTITGTTAFSSVGTRVVNTSSLNGVSLSITGANVTINGCATGVVTLTQGTLTMINSTVYGTNGNNALTSNSGSSLTLRGVTFYVTGTTTATRISVAGTYSFREAYFDNTNSTITGTSSPVPLTNDQTIVQNINGQSLSFNKLTPTTGTVVDLGDNTTSILLPKGTTAQQPSGVAGMIRYNSTTSQFEGYTSSWGAIAGGNFNPTISGSNFGDILTYDSVAGIWTNSLVPVKTLPSISASGFTVTLTAPVLLLSNVSVSTYKIQVATDTGFTSLVYDSPFQATGSFNLASLVTGGTTYYIRGLVRTDLNNKLTQWSTTTTWVAPNNGDGAYIFATRMNTTGNVSNTTGNGFNSNIVRDSSNNIYYFGSFGNGTLTIFNGDGTNSTTLTNLSATNLYLVKYTSSGSISWATRITPDSTTSSNNIEARGMAIDSSGNIYLAMASTGQVVCWNSTTGSVGPVGNSGVNDAYVTKYNTNGVCQWATRISGADNESFSTVSFVSDSSGNTFIGLNTRSSTISVYNNGGAFTNYTTNATTFISRFVIVKYSTTGLAQWVSYTNSGTTENYLYTIKLDNNGDVYASAYYSSNSNLVPGSGSNIALNFTGTGTLDTVIIKYTSSNGAAIIVRIGGTQTTGNVFMNFDSSNNLIFTGYFSSATAVVYNPGSSSSGFRTINRVGTGTNGLVVEFNSSLSTQWVSSWGPSSGNVFTSIVLTDTNNNVIVGGYIQGNTTIVGATGLNTSVSNLGSNTLVVAKYNSSGVIQWVGRTGKSGSGSTPITMAIDNQGSIYIFNSYFGGSIDIFDKDNFNFATIPNSGSADMVLVKYTSAGLVQWANMMSSTQFDYGTNMSFDGNNNLYVSGNYSGNPLTIFNSDRTTTFATLPNTANSGVSNTFVVKLF